MTHPLNFLRNLWSRFCFFYKDEYGEECDDFFCRVVRQNILEDQLGQNKFIRRVDLSEKPGRQFLHFSFDNDELDVPRMRLGL